MWYVIKEKKLNLNEASTCFASYWGCVNVFPVSPSLLQVVRIAFYKLISWHRVWWQIWKAPASLTFSESCCFCFVWTPRALCGVGQWKKGLDFKNKVLVWEPWAPLRLRPPVSRAVLKPAQWHKTWDGIIMPKWLSFFTCTTCWKQLPFLYFCVEWGKICLQFHKTKKKSPWNFYSAGA